MPAVTLTYCIVFFFLVVDESHHIHPLDSLQVFSSAVRRKCREIVITMMVIIVLPKLWAFSVGWVQYYPKCVYFVWALNPFPKQALVFTCLQYKSFEKRCGKRRNCSWWAISPFPTVFSTRLDNFLPFSSNLELLPANSFSLEGSNICRLGKG